MDALDLAKYCEQVFSRFPDGVFVFDLENAEDDRSLRLVYLNEPAAQKLDLSPALARGRFFDQVFPAARAKELPQQLARVVTTSTPFAIDEFFYVDHRVIGQWFSISAFPIAESLVGVIFQDLSAKKRENEHRIAEMARKDAEARLNFNSVMRLSAITREWTAIFDAIPEFVTVIGEDFRIKRINRSFASFLSCEPKDLIGRLCYEVVHGLDHPWHNCPHMKSLESGESCTEEVEDPAVGFPMLVTCVPYSGNDGEQRSSIHIARDISAQRNAIDDQHRLIAELQNALASVNLLSGLLPICANCKKIRDDSGYWRQIEAYICEHSEAEFSHGICPDCIKKLYPDYKDEG